MKFEKYATRRVLSVLLATATTLVAGLALLSADAPAGALDQRPAVTADSKAPLSCAALKTINLPDVRITAADAVDIQSQWGPGGRSRPFDVQHPFCRVQGVIETEIGFELWLPAKEFWNGKFLGAGVGGDAGTFNYSDLPRGLLRGRGIR